MKLSELKLKTVAIALALLTSTVAQAAMVTIKLHQDTNARTFKTSQSGDSYLELVKELPSGTKIVLSEDAIVDRPLVKFKNGKIKRSRSNYLGPVKLEKGSFFGGGLSRKQIKKLNKQDLYVYRWDVDITPLLKLKFDKRVPKGSSKVKASVGWNKISTKGYWTVLAKESLDKLGADLIENTPKDVVDFCPNYFNLDDEKKKIFWIHLMSSISKRESDFDPMATSDESQYQASLTAISRGLLQISYKSARSSRYKSRGCTPSKATDLNDPQVNMECGVAIFSYLSKDGCISCKKGKSWKGIARYWSTLRQPYKLSCKSCSKGYITIGKKFDIIDEIKRKKICK
jgi:hypothetical protein